MKIASPRSVLDALQHEYDAQRNADIGHISAVCRLNRRCLRGFETWTPSKAIYCCVYSGSVRRELSPARFVSRKR